MTKTQMIYRMIYNKIVTEHKCPFCHSTWFKVDTLGSPTGCRVCAKDFTQFKNA